jgi:hypothetical protein
LRWPATAATFKKGPNLTGIDPLTRDLEVLFHPRKERRSDHFAFRNVHLEGLTPTGRATVAVLALNDARRIGIRLELLALGELD